MKIAQISPLYEAVPPITYGGTERVVSYLTEELVNQGHEVTLFASGDSLTTAQLIATVEQGLRLNPTTKDCLAPHLIQLHQVYSLAKEFDILHFHTDYLHFPLSHKQNFPNLTTLHGRLDIPELTLLYQTFSKMPVVSISHAQRLGLPMANWVGNVYHGLPRDLYSFQPSKGKYLAFLGRISPEKRLDRAIEIAKSTDIPLKIAAKIDPFDQKYFDLKIKDLLNHPLIEYLGEISEYDKNEFLGNALTLLFPIDWPEPFGMVVIESLSCGTPVIAYDCGSISELISHGETGFKVRSQNEAIQAVLDIEKINRFRCRQEFLNRFTAEHMTDNYLRIYHQLLGQFPVENFAPETTHLTAEFTKNKPNKKEQPAS